MQKAKQETDKYLLKDMLVFGKSWSIEQMLNDAEIQNLVSNRYPNPVPRLQSGESRGKRRRIYACTQKSSKEGVGECSGHRELDPSGPGAQCHSRLLLTASRKGWLMKNIKTWRQSILTDSSQTHRDGRARSPHPGLLGKGEENEEVSFPAPEVFARSPLMTNVSEWVHVFEIGCEVGRCYFSFRWGPAA